MSLDSLVLSFSITTKCHNYYILRKLHTYSDILKIVSDLEVTDEKIISSIGNYLISLLQKVSSTLLPFNASSNYELDLNRDCFVVNHLQEYFPIPTYLGVQIVSRIRFLAHMDLWSSEINLDEYLPPHLVLEERYDERLIQEMSFWLFRGKGVRKRYIRLMTASFYYASKEIVNEVIFFTEEKRLYRLIESPLFFVLLSVYNLNPDLADLILEN